MDEKMLYRVREVAEYLSLSRSKVYALMQSGALPSVRIDGAPTSEVRTCGHLWTRSCPMAA